ncbi:MAG: exodeoxyribonuclease VII small subunit [Candidatus Krumholzibacteria bacterium]|nr:exodeoxyribonuclease VII small subunit [Candidatus Krumholzibacteria bacterium]
MSEKKDNFEQSMKRLEKIVEELDKGDFSLEDSLQKFEEGLKLGKTCREMLDKAESRVRKLVENEEGSLCEEETDEF